MTADVVSIKLPKTSQVLHLDCLLLLLIPKGTSQFLVQFVPVIGFFCQDLFILVFSPKNMTHSMLLNCLLSNLLHFHHFP